MFNPVLTVIMTRVRIKKH